MRAAAVVVAHANVIEFGINLVARYLHVIEFGINLVARYLLRLSGNMDLNSEIIISPIHLLRFGTATRKILKILWYIFIRSPNETPK